MAFLPMTKSIFKGLFHKPATLEFPFAPMPKDPIVRGQIQIGINECIFCGICQRKCPTHAITVDKASKSWAIERCQCIVCAACTEVCPKKCLHMSNELTPAMEDKQRDQFAQEAAPATEANSTGA